VALGIRAARETARKSGRQLLVLPGDDEADLLQAFDLAARGVLDGLILFPTTKLVEQRALKVSESGRTVVATNLPRRTRLPVVELDLRSVGRLAASHLWSLGHRSVMTAGPSSGGEDARFSSFVAEWTRLGGTVTPHLTGRGTAEDGLRAGRAVAAEVGRRGVTAVFAFTDDFAVGVIAGLADAGLDVPGDVSVIGCDNAPLGQFLRPALTTIDPDNAGLMDQAVRLVVELLDGGPTRRRRHKIAATLTVRDSTRPVC